jgi:ectoine hydroxylase
MRLTKEQLNSYEQNGYLLVPDCFSKDELEPIAYELPRVFEENTPRKVLERSGAVRSVFAPHVSNETFDRLSRLPRMLEPARQLLDDDVYIHQFKINAKVALEGDQWEWHQDFVYWHREDSMPAPRALTAVLFMQDVNEFNGPMLVIPGSHKEGMLDIVQLDKFFADALTPDELERSEPTWAATLTADLKYKIRKDILARMALKNEIHAVKGSAGSVLFFHSLLLHASSNNLSPWDRVCVFVTYNSVSNTLGERPNPRPEYIAHRDFSPLIPLAQDEFLEVEVGAL